MYLALTCSWQLDMQLKIFRAAISEPFQFETNWLPLGVSIRAAIAPKDGLTLEALMECADKAMYQNKRERKRLDNPAH